MQPILKMHQIFLKHNNLLALADSAHLSVRKAATAKSTHKELEDPSLCVGLGLTVKELRERQVSRKSHLIAGSPPPWSG